MLGLCPIDPPLKRKMELRVRLSYEPSLGTVLGRVRIPWFAHHSFLTEERCSPFRQTWCKSNVNLEGVRFLGPCSAALPIFSRPHESSSASARIHAGFSPTRDGESTSTCHTTARLPSLAFHATLHSSTSACSAPRQFPHATCLSSSHPRIFSPIFGVPRLAWTNSASHVDIRPSQWDKMAP